VFGNDGALLDDANPDAIRHIRQVCFSMYKLEVPYSPESESRVISSFVSVEQELPASYDVDGDPILDAASYIIRDVFESFDPFDIIPRHGPGAVATGEKMDAKWDFSRLYSSIHRVYPYYDYYMVGWGDELIDRLKWWRSLERCESGTAKVVLVPKDSRGPRLISAEPLEYQWIQQGLGRGIMSHLSSHPWTRGNVNFFSQDKNRELALSSSLDNSYSTLDLKDASDRVSVALVSKLFAHSDKLLSCLLATRTTATKLPDGSVVGLKKFAPMGSALCFPIEAIVFWSIIVAAISRETHLPRELVGKDVFVFGDDIIVPRPWADLSMRSLERYALVVNRSKSCIEGLFRESCGMDAFRGEDVTPTRFKKLFTGTVTDGSAYVSYVSYANSLEAKGYKRTSVLLWALIEQTYGLVPHGLADSPFPCRVEDCWSTATRLNLLRGFKSRLNRELQRREFKVRMVTSRMSRTLLDSWQRLMRNLVMPPFLDPSVIVWPRSMKTKRGWSMV
jgi:hypothetical protein